MNAYRKTGRTVGILFITATVAGILGMVFSGPLQAPDYLVNIAENENQVLIASLFTLVMAVAVAGIAISAYPVFKKENASLAMGYVGARIVESILYIVTVISWLLLIVLSQSYIIADAAYFQTLGDLLQAVSGWAGHVVLDVIVAPLFYLIFYYLLYRSKLVPRWLSVWGLIGIPLGFVAGILAAVGHDPTSSLPIFLNLPIAINEMVLAVWLILKGFNPAAFEHLSA